MSLIVSFCAVFFPRDVLDEILNLIKSVSERFPTYNFKQSISNFAQIFIYKLKDGVHVIFKEEATKFDKLQNFQLI